MPAPCYSPEAPHIDSTATFERLERVADALSKLAIGNDVIRNHWEEPLAVFVESAVSSAEIGAIAEAALDEHHEPAVQLAPEIANTLPVFGKP